MLLKLKTIIAHIAKRAGNTYWIRVDNWIRERRSGKRRHCEILRHLRSTKGGSCSAKLERKVHSAMTVVAFMTRAHWTLTWTREHFPLEVVVLAALTLTFYRIPRLFRTHELANILSEIFFTKLHIIARLFFFLRILHARGLFHNTVITFKRKLKISQTN